MTLDKNASGGSVTVEVTPFGFHFETMHIGFQCIVHVLYFHKLQCVGVYVHIPEFQMKYIPNVVPALPSMKCLMNKCVG